jgi:biopolymer transport protein ExbB
MDAMINFFQTGGLFMYPILIVFAFGIAIVIERWLKLNAARNANKKMWDSHRYRTLVEAERCAQRK